MKSTDSRSAGNRPMLLENRPTIIRFMTIPPFASMTAKSISEPPIYDPTQSR